VALLTSSGPDFVQAWLRSRTLREEDRCESILVLTSTQVERLAASAAGQVPCLRPQDRSALVEMSAALRAGLLHVLSGLRMADVARQLGVPTSTAYRWVARHRAAMSDATYARYVADLVATGLRQAYGHVAHVRLPGAGACADVEAS
jgi:hypothetical protein